MDSIVLFVFQRAGCDNRLNSIMKLDRCGVCGGDGSSCQVIKGIITPNVKNGDKSLCSFSLCRYNTALIHYFYTLL